ncbi:hypothetical protein ACMC56_07095 [Campylobacterota bacterium DY0563]
MEKLKELIKDNSGKFEHFSYYLLLINKAEKNLLYSPDIAIESCKALIEGICKTILISLDKTISENVISGERYQFQRLFKESMDKLAEYDESFELEFVRGFNNNIRILGEIRTKRGDISHGKRAPKEEMSSHDFAVLIFNFTGQLIIYIVEHFFQIEFEEEVNYEDNEEFNVFLDENNPLPGKVKFSLALYEQYLEDYRTQLKQFLADKEDSDISLDEEKNYETIIEENEEIIKEKNQEIDKKLLFSDEILPIYKKYLTTKKSKVDLLKLCHENELYINKVLEVIDTYLFENRPPLSSSIIDTLKNKPKVLERNKKVKEISEKIFGYINKYLKG